MERSSRLNVVAIGESIRSSIYKVRHGFELNHLGRSQGEERKNGEYRRIPKALRSSFENEERSMA